MAARRPVVLNGTNVELLQPGDTLDGVGGGTQTVFPVLYVDFGTDDSSPPSGLPDTSAQGGPTLTGGEHIGATHGVWAVASGTWTLVHAWADGDLVLSMWNQWFEGTDPNYGGAFTYYSSALTPASIGQINNALANVYLSQLADVDYSTPPTTGDILIYDPNVGKWKPLIALTGAPTDGDVLHYNNSTGLYWAP